MIERFREGDRVFHWNYKEGIVLSVIPELNKLEIQFNKDTITKYIDCAEISFKPYTLISGGWSQDRPSEELNDLVGRVGLFTSSLHDKKIIGEVDYATDGLYIEKNSGTWFDSFELLSNDDLRLYNTIIGKFSRKKKSN